MCILLMMLATLVEWISLILVPTWAIRLFLLIERGKPWYLLLFGIETTSCHLILVRDIIFELLRDIILILHGPIHGLPVSLCRVKLVRSIIVMLWEQYLIPMARKPRYLMTLMLVNLSGIRWVHLPFSVSPQMTDVDLDLRLAISFILLTIKAGSTRHVEGTHSRWHPSTHQACIVGETCLVGYISHLVFSAKILHYSNLPMINCWCNVIVRFISLMRFHWVLVRITFSFVSFATRCALAWSRSFLGSRVLRILLIVILLSLIRWKRAMTAWMAQALPFGITLPLMVATWSSGRRRRLLDMRINLTRSNQERVWLVIYNKDLGGRHYELPAEFIYWLAAIGLNFKGMP